MPIQLIFVFETNSKSQTDLQYIKAVIDFYYVPRSYKITKIFANNKGNLTQCQNKINNYKKLFSGDSVVIMCADYDSDGDPLNQSIQDYCKKNGYELVWMNKDIEEVFLGYHVESRKKTKAALNFLKKSDSTIPSLTTLNSANPLNSHPSSNLLIVLDRYLTRNKNT